MDEEKSEVVGVITLRNKKGYELTIRVLDAKIQQKNKLTKRCPITEHKFLPWYEGDKHIGYVCSKCDLTVIEV